MKYYFASCYVGLSNVRFGLSKAAMNVITYGLILMSLHLSLTPFNYPKDGRSQSKTTKYGQKTSFAEG